MKLSAVICTHNPREDYLRRVLGALEQQTLDRAEWELLVIDNASKQRVGDGFDLAWHPRGRHIVEEELGLTPARLRGIAESSGDVIVFVDDDNVLAPDFLARALEVSAAFPFLGVWGGDIQPDFEITPPAWTKPFHPWLALRDITTPIWSNDPLNWASHPCGAGMCVRREMALAYADTVAGDARRRTLDRRGTSLVSSGDTDMVLLCGEQGSGWGMFPQLKLTHIISAGRLEEKYLVRLARGLSYSWTVLTLSRGLSVAAPPPLWRRALRFARSGLGRNFHEARVRWANDAGTLDGLRSAGAVDAA